MLRLVVVNPPKFHKLETTELAPIVDTVDPFTNVRVGAQLFKMFGVNDATGFGKTTIGVTVVEGQFKLLIKLRVITNEFVVL